jgi:hypothetical protein
MWKQGRDQVRIRVPFLLVHGANVNDIVDVGISQTKKTAGSKKAPKAEPVTPIPTSQGPSLEETLEFLKGKIEASLAVYRYKSLVGKTESNLTHRFVDQLFVRVGKSSLIAEIF